MSRQASSCRIAILWTIVIVFISQLFHCAYTNEQSRLAHIANGKQANHHHHFINHNHEPLYQASSQVHAQSMSLRDGQEPQVFHRQTYEDLLSSSSNGGGGIGTYEDQLIGGQLEPPQQQLHQQPQQQLGHQTAQISQSARERCRELISITLLSFRDLSPDERASEEIDCANLREQIAAAAANRNPQQQQRSSRAKQQQLPLLGQQLPVGLEEPIGGQTTPTSFVDESDLSAVSQPADEFPLAPVYSREQQVSSPRVAANLQASGRQAAGNFPRNQLPTTLPIVPSRSSEPIIGTSNLSSFQSSSNWQPKGSYFSQLQQLQLLQQQQQQQFQQQQQAQRNQQLEPAQPLASPRSTSSRGANGVAAARPKVTSTTTTTQPPTTTQTTTFESLFYETTTLPPPPQTTTTTTTTTTAAPAQPKIKVAGGGSGRRRAKSPFRSTTSTTTTTTTTTPKPATLADYADGSEVSTDYYDEYEDQTAATTTTTTTTQRPRGGRTNGKKPPRRRHSTTPRPTTTSTTTTTLSPGYQPRPDGRIIDYMADPNFPRELKGADLTDYPFYINVPDKIDFECKGRHDGYYTNIDLHCQIYHHCAVGNRYDFLCPNYTLFDQTTFTCRFINTVDCSGSAKHFDRNNALYVEKDEKDSSASSSSASASSSTTTSTTSTTTQAPPRLNIQMSHRSGQLRHPQAITLAPISALALISKPANATGSSPVHTLPADAINR